MPRENTHLQEKERTGKTRPTHTPKHNTIKSHTHNRNDNHQDLSIQVFFLVFCVFFYCEETIVRTIEKNHEESESVRRRKKERAEKSDASREKKKKKLLGGGFKRRLGGDGEGRTGVVEFVGGAGETKDPSSGSVVLSFGLESVAFPAFYVGDDGLGRVVFEREMVDGG